MFVFFSTIPVCVSEVNNILIFLIDRDHIVICYENDGEEVARFMKTKLSDEKYKCRVSLAAIDGDDYINLSDVRLSILLLTPEMKESLHYHIDEDRLNSLFPSPKSSVVIRHSVEEDDDVHSLLTAHIKGFDLWYDLDLGTNGDDFKAATIKIMEMVDKPPTLKQFSIIPKIVRSVSHHVFTIRVLLESQQYILS